jgi:electron transport complex protein RnfD
MTGATILGHVRTELAQGEPLSRVVVDMFDPFSAMFGTIAGSLGETSAVLVAFGGIWLIHKRVIGWHIPVSMLAAMVVLSTVANLIDPEQYLPATVHILSGGTLVAAFFIATDPVTSPVSRAGQLLFGAGVGVLVYIIRTWGGYPEGAAFAILLMNAATPMIDHYLKPRIYGRDRRGKPLEYPQPAAANKPEGRA